MITFLLSRNVFFLSIRLTGHGHEATKCVEAFYAVRLNKSVEIKIYVNKVFFYFSIQVLSKYSNLILDKHPHIKRLIKYYSHVFFQQVFKSFQ